MLIDARQADCVRDARYIKTCVHYHTNGSHTLGLCTYSTSNQTTTISLKLIRKLDVYIPIIMFYK